MPALRHRGDRMKQCPNCGRFSEDNAVSCANCGTVYPRPDASPAGDGTRNPSPGSTPSGDYQNGQWNPQPGNNQNQPWNGQPGGYQNQPWGSQQGGYQQPWSGQQSGYQNGQPYGGYQNGQWNGQSYGGYDPQRQGWNPYGGYQAPYYGGTAPMAKTKKEFLKLPENKKMRTELMTCGILCYITAGFSLVFGVAVAKTPAVLLDVALILGLGLGIHLTQSRTCAVLLLIYSVINCILSIVVNGQVGGYFVIIAGIFAVVYTFRLEKTWQQYRQQTGQLQPPQGPEV